MKFLAAILTIGLAVVVSAQSVCDVSAAAIPSCGASCLISAGSLAGCHSTDYACQCSSSQSSVIQASAQACVIGGCGAISNALAVLASAKAVCSCAATAVVAGSTPASTSAKTTDTVQAVGSFSPGSYASQIPSATAPATTTAIPTSLTSSTVAASATTSASFTGGVGNLRPEMGFALSVVALFAGLVAVL